MYFILTVVGFGNWKSSEEKGGGCLGRSGEEAFLCCAVLCWLLSCLDRLTCEGEERRLYSFCQRCYSTASFMFSSCREATFPDPVPREEGTVGLELPVLGFATRS